MDSNKWKHVFTSIKQQGLLINDNVITNNFQDVVNKAFDPDMGFGYISENGYKPNARVILQGKNPFLDNHTGLLSSVMAGYLPYSQVYQVADGGGNTLCILRHYLNIPALSAEELGSIKVASCRLENMDNIEFKSSSTDNGVTCTDPRGEREEITAEQKSSVLDNENQGGSIPVGKNSTQLLDQMNQIVGPNAKMSVEKQEPGQIIVTVHKARNIEKKGIMGKADPYVVITFGSQKEKSVTVNNNHDPVWHITGCFDVEEQYAKDIIFEVFDDDISKDGFLGKAVIEIHEIYEAKDFMNKWIPLEKCESGQILISARFIPLKKINRPIGHVSLTVHKAKKIEKKNMLKKADPYVLIKLGKEEHKSNTVNNSQKPKWNFDAEFDIKESSSRQISLEVFDEDIGNDANIGNITIDMDTIIKKRRVENLWTKLENCKSGEVLISAKFTPSPSVDVNEEDISNSTVTLEKEVIIKELETQKEQMTFLDKPNQQCHLEPINSHGQDIEFVDPIYCDDEYVVVEKNNKNWFLVVSSLANLPINVNLVPFKKTSDTSSAIFLYPLPRGGFHNIKRVIHSGNGLKKCGYEKLCVLRAGEPYQFWSDAQGQNFNLGTLQANTFGPDNSWVVYKEEYFKPQDYIEVTLSSEANGPEFSGPISLYDRLSVDAA